jgi:PII-like signaling protein
MEMLRFYVSEKQRHNGDLVYEWLLEEARRQGIPGGSVFRAISGYGRHGRLHEETFFELGGDLPVMVELVLETLQAEQFLEALRPHGLKLYYVRQAAEAGVV